MNQHLLLNIGAGADGAAAVQFAQKLKPARLWVAASTPADAARIQAAVPGVEPAVGTDIPILAPRTAADAPQTATDAERAWVQLARAARESEGALEILSVGALTNIAVALVRWPELAAKIKRVVLLGGSAESGDVTPFAERSVFADPCAAEILFKSGVPVLMFGLNCLGAEKRIADSAELLPVAAAVSADFYRAARCFVGVETRSGKTRGMTVCDLYGRNGKEPNADVVLELKPAALFGLLDEINGGERA